MPSRAKTSAGNVKMNLALDPRAAELLYEMAADRRSLGTFVSNLILAEARFRHEEELRARVRAQGRPASELRDALERLEASEARYNRLAGRMSAIVFEMAPDGTVLFVNQAITDITGFQLDELAERAWRERLFPAELADAPARLYHALAHGDVSGYEVVMGTKAGGRVVVELNSANRYARDGELEQIVGFAVDITRRRQAEMATRAAQEELRQANEELERRVQERTAALAAANEALQAEAAEHWRTEAALRASEERFRTSVENLFDAFGIFSALRDQSGMIVDFIFNYVNDAACRSNRLPREAQIGRRLLEVLPGHRESGLFEEYRRVVETGQPFFRESLVYRDDYAGRRLTRVFDIRATRLGDGFTAAWRDTTHWQRIDTPDLHEFPA